MPRWPVTWVCTRPCCGAGWGSSGASNLALGDTNGKRDVFLRDRGEPGFPDVPPGYWAHDEIVACFLGGIVQGYPDGLYHPEVQVTRDQMAVYISRALVTPTDDAAIPEGPATASFTDVASSHWACKWIEYAVAKNVIKGYPDGTYVPAGSVDRGQMAVYIARAMVAPGGDAAVPAPTGDPTFPDVPAEHWVYQQVEYCADHGVVKGYPDGTYQPAVVVTRDQMAVYVARAFELQ